MVVCEVMMNFLTKSFISLFVSLLLVLLPTLSAHDHESGLIYPPPELEQVFPFYQHYQTPHEFSFILSGPIALKERLALIESAQESIEFEYFTFKTDQAARLIAQALADKADKGIEVRVLFDFFATSTRLSMYHVREFLDRSIQIRFYNHSLDVFNAQFRNHRKMIVVDGKKALLGGRNITDQYFGLDSDYNLMDRDFIIQGQAVKAIQESFFKFWEAPETSERIAAPRGFSYLSFYQRIRALQARRFFETSRGDKELLDKVDELTRGEVLPTFDCRNLVFVSDVPTIGADAFKSNNRFTRNLIFNEFSRAQREVLMESPYIVLDSINSSIVESLHDNQIEMAFKTNGLVASNMFPATTAFVSRIGKWLDRGVVSYFFNGSPYEDHQSFSISEDAVWGSHSKTMIIDDKVSILGSFNFDPRSVIWNHELALICRDRDMTSFIRESFDRRKVVTSKVTSNRELLDYKERELNYWERIKYRLVKWPARLIEFLL